MRPGMNKGFPDYPECRDGILEEFIRIRHAYNNMMQTLTCYIEEEDWEGLKEYKEILLEKTQVLNRNNLTQLVRIKDKYLLVILYKLLMDAKENGIAVNMTVFNDIPAIGPGKTNFYEVLYNHFQYAYELAAGEAEEIDLKVSAEDRGLVFNFKNSFRIKPSVSDERSTLPRINRNTGKNMYINTFLNNGYRIQEIIIHYSD